MTLKILKPISIERSLTAANNVATSSLVRVLNPTGSAVVLTFKLADTTTYANCTINPSIDRIIKKAPTDTLTGAGLLGVAVTYED